MRKLVAVIVAAALAAGAGYVGWQRLKWPAGPAALTIAVQPLGPVARKTTSTAAAAIRGYYGARVVVLKAVPLPTAAYTRPRARYRADRLLDFLAGEAYRSYDKVLGLTERDISTTKGPIPDWGVFGLGSVGGKACVVSTFRLRRGANEAKLLGRLAKVVNHEVGHTLGLQHCPVPGCMMADAKGTIAEVDRESPRLCATCRRRIGLP